MVPEGRRRSRLVGALAFVGVLSLLAAACGSSTKSSSTASGSGSSSLTALVPAALKAKGEIVFGGPQVNPPFLFKDSTSQALTGIDYELGQAIGKELGLKVSFVNTPFPALIPALDAGKFDAILNSMDDLPTREKVVTFVDYAIDGAAFMVKKGNPAGITTLSSLCGKSIALLQGSMQVTLVQNQQAKCAAANKPAIQAAQFGSVGDALLAVTSGRDDAFFASLPASLYHQKVQPGTFELPPNTKNYAPTFIGAGVAKGDAPLAQALQSAIRSLIANGTYGKIFAKFGYAPGVLKTSQVKIDGGASYDPNASTPVGE
ncbi:MAG: ABC transporter substrate-binding protein [Acidimicrobiales bacterium]